ncbi:dihydrofolate reductase [Candidatus Saccharibacteria bacterium]|nr:dihydrofolate reductase [Candidatus Saccharibacteria bacterium]
MENIHKEPRIIVAYDADRCIGVGNQLPWAGRLRADMKHFKQQTMGNIVLMGRTTYDSIGRPLPGRENRILTRQEDLVIPGCKVFTDPEEALLDSFDDPRELYVIGGEQVYRQYLPMSRFIVSSEIDHSFNGDAFFPAIDEDEWDLVASELVIADSNEDFNFTINTRKRKYIYIDTSKARSAEQHEQYRRIELEGDCPFCQEAIDVSDPSEMKIVSREPSWTVISNMVPYENTDTHLVAISDRHMRSPAELTQTEWLDLHEVIKKYTGTMAFGGIALRFGDFTQTGASVAHLHVHIIKPEDDLKADQKVRFKISR